MGSCWGISIGKEGICVSLRCAFAEGREGGNQNHWGNRGIENLIYILILRPLRRHT